MILLEIENLVFCSLSFIYSYFDMFQIEQTIESL